jgi:hypothetical protein
MDNKTSSEITYRYRPESAFRVNGIYILMTHVVLINSLDITILSLTASAV